MYLLSFRIIEHPAIPHTSWIKVGNGLNIFTGIGVEQARFLFKMLQTVNPPYDFERIDPFKDLPLYNSGHRYTKKIVLSKKTAAIAIFAASVQLVENLAAIDPVLHETDRIELGRRRDYSRWINFVELSSSTRWDEIESTVRDLLSCSGPDSFFIIERLANTISNLYSTDRIKGAVAVELRERLAALCSCVPENKQAQLNQCLYAIDRAQRFRQAREVAEDYIPLFISITKSMLLGYPVENSVGKTAKETNSALFDFLLRHPRKRAYLGQASFEERLSRMNLILQNIHPGLTLHFREDRFVITFETAKKSVALAFPDHAPACEMEVLLSVLATLHKEQFDCNPIFLFDISKMDFERQESEELFKILHRQSFQWQSLVLPDKAFLNLCADSCEDDEDNAHPFLIRVNPSLRAVI